MNNPPHQTSLLIPLIIICLGFGMALFATGGNTHVTAQQGYPAPNVTASPPSAYPPPASPTVGRSPIATTAVPPTAPPAPATPTPTMPPTPTALPIPTAPPTMRPTLTSTPLPTRVPPTTLPLAQVAETMPPTPTAPGVLECASGRLVVVSGTAPPHAPLLIYFGTRIVGGGSARASGDFALPLIPGMEQAGTYEVTVRIRGTGQIVRSVTCTVPPTTPTPVPRQLR